MEGDRRRDADDREVLEGPQRAGARGLARLPVNDEFCKERIEVRRDLAALEEPRVDPDAGAPRRVEVDDPARRGQEIQARVLRVDPALDRVAAEADLILGRKREVPTSERELRPHDIDSGHGLRHGVLDLQARVDLEEEVALRGHEELHGPRGAVAPRARDSDGVGVEAPAQRLVEVGRRALLDELLVAPLHGTVALEEVDDGAPAVPEDLHLDVAGARKALLHVEFPVPEGLPGFAGGRLEGLGKARGALDAADPAAAAPIGGFEEDRKAEALGSLARLVRVAQRPVRAGNRWHPGVLGEPSRHGLHAEGLHRTRRGAHEHDAFLLDAACELGVFGEEPVPGVQRIGSRPARGRHDPLDVQVGGPGVVPLEALDARAVLEVRGPRVPAREDADGLDPELARRAEHADGDFPPVRDDEAADHRSGDGPRGIKRGRRQGRLALSQGPPKRSLPGRVIGIWGACLDARTFADVLTKFVRPYNHPLAIRMVRHGEGAPEKAKRPLRDFKHPITICQAIAVARQVGWTVYMGREDQACILGAVAMGFEGMHPYYVDGNLCENFYTKTKEAGAKMEAAVPRFSPGAYQGFLVASLERADFAPDVFAFYGNSAQVMRLVSASLWESGGRMESSAEGRLDCADLVERAMLTGKPAYVLPCNGDRVFGMVEDSEMGFSAPWSAVDSIAKGLEETHKAGIRYPVPRQLTFLPSFPKSYDKLWELIGAEAKDPAQGRESGG